MTENHQTREQQDTAHSHQAVGDRSRKGKVDEQVQGNPVRGEIGSTNTKTEPRR